MDITHPQYVTSHHLCDIFPSTYNLDPVRRKHHERPSGEAFCKILHSYSTKMSKSQKMRKDWKRARNHNYNRVTWLRPHKNKIKH
jgi:hypothetical protein